MAGLILIAGCNSRDFLSPVNGIGTLEGTIEIGPLCPVETIPPDPACQPTAETYKAYPVGIWTADGKVQVNTISPNLDGSFTLQLPDGFYLVNRENPKTGPGGSNLPVIIPIESGNTTFLKITIDTGIR